MLMKKMVITTFSLTHLLIPVLILTSGVIAGENHGHEEKAEQRQHGSHVHGVASLNLALGGDEVHIELESPAANIVGFEHTPSSDADHAVLDKAITMLKDGEKLFAFNESADCSLEKAHVESALLQEEHGHEDHDKHEHEQETHSDIEAVYHFECENPRKLSQLTVELFEAFPGMEKLNVQYVIENRQGASVLTSGSHVIKF